MTTPYNEQRFLQVFCVGDRVVAFDFGDHGTITASNHRDDNYNMVCRVLFDNDTEGIELTWHVSRLEMEPPLYQLARVGREIATEAG